MDKPRRTRLHPAPETRQFQILFRRVIDLIGIDVRDWVFLPLTLHFPATNGRCQCMTHPAQLPPYRQKLVKNGAPIAAAVGITVGYIAEQSAALARCGVTRRGLRHSGRTHFLSCHVGGSKRAKLIVPSTIQRK
jgi:hypothetical protein